MRRDFDELLGDLERLINSPPRPKPKVSVMLKKSEPTMPKRTITVMMKSKPVQPPNLIWQGHASKINLPAGIIIKDYR